MGRIFRNSLISIWYHYSPTISGKSPSKSFSLSLGVNIMHLTLSGKQFARMHGSYFQELANIILFSYSLREVTLWVTGFNSWFKYETLDHKRKRVLDLGEWDFIFRPSRWYLFAMCLECSNLGVLAAIAFQGTLYARHYFKGEELWGNTCQVQFRINFPRNKMRVFRGP